MGCRRKWRDDVIGHALLKRQRLWIATGEHTLGQEALGGGPRGMRGGGWIVRAVN